MKVPAKMSLLSKMKPGKVYRRKELESLSGSLDRDLHELCVLGQLSKAASGLYIKEEQSEFGPLPPRDRDLVKAFLDDNRFLLMSFNHYNSLGLGLTQLRNDIIVYNRKRHLKTKLGGREFVFKNVREFPNKLSKEYLLVDMLNNLKKLGESPAEVLANLEKKKQEFDSQKVAYMANRYGKIKTKKIIREIYG